MTFPTSFRTGLLAGLAAAGAAGLTLLVMRRRAAQTAETEPDYPAYDDPLDEAAAESFPASDPPSHAATLGATPRG